MNRPSARVLIRIIYLLLIFFATVITLLIVFLSQFDLDDYRHSLEQQLSFALKQPVQIGHSSLTYYHGLALRLQQLQIGHDYATLVQIPLLTATFKIAPLFKKQFIFNQIQIDKPSFQLRLPFSDHPAGETSHQLINTLGINTLIIRDANLKIYRNQGVDAVKHLEISNLHAVLRGWQPEKTGHLVITGQLQKQNAEFLLETRLPSSTDPKIWREEEHRTRLRVTHFSTSAFPKSYSRNYPESLNFDLHIQGAPATGADFSAVLSGADNNEQIIFLSGCWTSSSQQDSITKLEGELLKIPLSGEFYFIRQPKKYSLAGHFEAKDIKLNPQLFEAWRIPNADKLINGELDRLAIILEKTWDPANKFSGLPRIDAEITLCNLNWDIPELKQFQDFSVDLSLENRNLHINNGILIAGGYLLDFSGQVQSLFLKPQIDMNLNFNPGIDKFKTQLNLPDNWNISGDIHGSLKLNGALFNPDFQLQADLNPTKLQLGSLFHKQQTDQATLQLQGNLTNNRLQLDQFTFTLNDTSMTGTGYFQQYQGKQEYNFAVQPINLDKLKPFSPLLQKFQLQGEVEPSIMQQQTGLQGSLKLRNIGAHLTSVISDIQNTTGEIHFDRHGFTFQKLKTSLGKSDFIVDGLLSDWQNPQLSLDLIGKKIHAHDLIFPNQKMTFYDLDGHLRINRDSISFSPIKVRLEKNTLATIHGKVTDFNNPQVSLDIQSETVDVLDIIKLFKNPLTADIGKQKRKGKPLLIKASVKQGTLGNLRFKNAEALIRNHNGLLTIFPLNFQNGKGWCRARVEFNRKQKTAPLKVSGHMEGINASVLHQDLLKKRGLINGNLRGDFYVEGNPVNNRFWHNAKGGLYLQIRGGTLRKFHVLAKVFSLLNVSQIFVGKLPDMDKKGMPFTLMEGSVQLANGQMKTKDLKITSEAMNLALVGTMGLVNDTLDFNLGVMPLRTVDKIITLIPIAGWLIAGKDKALLTAQFKIEGTSKAPKVTPIPIGSVSDTVFGIFKRTLGLPEKLVKDIGSLLKKESKKKVGP